MLMNKKEFYTSPEVDAFEVRYEGVVCASPKGSFDEKADVEEGNSTVFW